MFFSYKNHVYKNVEAEITLKFKNVVVILLVAISISFRGSFKIRRCYEKKNELSSKQSSSIKHIFQLLVDVT